ncbi:glycosyltransferase family 4 protein [Hafnia alvei]|uniref:glycosyltransferase family 4 protein n=1 Tax=Hafnia alvei TaxID=569 RepID=UPI000B6BFC9B|nr:glycosyltransferase family 4 protein [Hafnia alvei]MBI0274370.1 glycosyltransferase family 4 protein [Hafnia alvei]PNK99580.1 glycosyltransferase family 4 protein [Hafnia alvei]
MSVIFFVGDISSNGGVERVTVTLANALCDQTDVTIVSLYGISKNIAFEIDSRICLDILNPLHETSMYNRCFGIAKGAIFDCKYIFSKKAIINKKYSKNCDAVFVSCDVKMTLLLFASLGRANKKNIIAIEHFEHDVISVILKKIRSCLYSRIGAVVSLTNEDAFKYARWLDKRRHIVIPNIVEEVRTEVANDLVRENTVLAVGRLCEQKGFDLLLKAWNIAHTKGWKLKIIGEGNDREYLQQLIKDYGLSNVSLVGFKNNLDSEYASAKVFILSSRYEGLGMVLLEALSHGLACISFDCPAGPKSILSKNNGILVPAEDVDRLAIAISELLSDNKLIKKYCSIGPSSIDKYKKANVKESWLKLIRMVNNNAI